MLNAGPFASILQAFMQGLQSMGNQNTGGHVQTMGNHDTGGQIRIPGGQFRSRMGPLQLQTLGDHGSNQPAGGAPAPASEGAEDEEEDEDDLEKLETDFASATKAEAAIRKKQQKLEKQRLLEEGEASAISKKPAAGGKAAKPKAEGKAAGPHGKGKAAGGKGKGKAAAPTAKGKSAAPKAKVKAAAAAGAKPPGKFDVAGWIVTNITRTEAAAEPKRRNFVSRLHKRAESYATQWGVDDVQPITKRARDAAGDVHDAVHKKE
jgi:hypothetical protein